jgi:hypothetical protein
MAKIPRAKVASRRSPEPAKPKGAKVVITRSMKARKANFTFKTGMERLKKELHNKTKKKERLLVKSFNE